MFLLVAVVFERFLIDYKDPEWKHIEPFKWWLLVHGIAGTSALILGPMQCSDRLRHPRHTLCRAGCPALRSRD
jgi:hypothetical protein